MAPSASPRFGFWVTFFIFSTITLGATIEAQAHTDRLSPGAQTNQNYALATTSLLFFLSTLFVTLHTRPVLSTVVIGTKIEGAVISLLLLLSSALVAIVSDTRHGLATDSTGSISNGNLYYFSWAALATGVKLLSSYLRSVFGLDVAETLSSQSVRLQSWIWLVLLGLIQMGSAARLFDNHCGMTNSGLVEEKGSITFCRRCQLGIALGAVSAIAAMGLVAVKIWVRVKRRMGWLFTAEMVVSGMVVGGQAVGVTFLTSQMGPGAPLNNLYYSSWGAFVAGLVLVASCVDDYSNAGAVLRSEAAAATVEDEVVD